MCVLFLVKNVMSKTQKNRKHLENIELSNNVAEGEQRHRE